MHVFNSISAKAVVWLAAILVPMEAMPMKACDCGSQSALEKANVGSRTHHCCGGKAASAIHGNCCCCAEGPCHCRCKDKHGLHRSSCQCTASNSAPDPAPLPINSRTGNTKVSLASFLDTLITVACVAPSSARPNAGLPPSRIVSTSLERLCELCRLVV